MVRRPRRITAFCCNESQSFNGWLSQKVMTWFVAQ